MLNMKTGKRIVSMMLVLAFVILMIPDLDIRLGAAVRNGLVYTFEAGDVAVITQKLINEVASGMPAEDAAVFRKSPVFQITQGVYSVTVNGPFSYTDPTTNVKEEISVTVIFGQQSGGTYTGVTIDRTNESVSNNGRMNARVGDAASGYADLSVLSKAGQDLGWSNNYVPTAPFMIMNGAKVKTLFLGNCEIKAGRNRVSVSYGQTNLGTNRNPNWVEGYSLGTSGNRCGYAGIQVEGSSQYGPSSLEIMDVTGGKLSVYGSYQLAGTNGYDTDPLKVNPIFDNKNGRDPYAAPSGANYRYRAGGAAIGGGAPYNADDSVSVGYKAGTPGTIIINGGEIYAVGGHLAAAIGGAFNGASTTSKIEINGGNITAIGGRYATGIGDGDTVDRQYTDNRSGPSPCFGEPAQIIINGGTIDAYGGTAAAAIGTGDKITMSEGLGETARSRLQISITGGVINAQSGEADTNSWAGEVTAAAIGVGQSTYMVENSITIHSNATVFARSFSIYAISEKPITENQAGTVVPMVNIDPEGYMYLARFTGNNQARELTLYPVFKDIMDKPIAFQGDAHQVLTDESSIGTLYAVDSTDTGKALYQVKNENVGNGKPIFVIDGSTYDNPDYFLNTDSQKNNFSYYYDKTAGREFDVPANYKAVALSLKKGDYVFHVPLNLSDNGENRSLTDDVYAHFHKELPGTTSGQVIDYRDEDNDNKDAFTSYHFLYHQNNNGETEVHESSNVKIDGTAEAFTNIRLTSITNPSDVFLGLVTSEEVPATTYVPTTLGYKVYLPNGTKQFDLNLLYETAGINIQSIALHCEGLGFVSGDVDMSSGEVTGRDGDNTVRLEFGTDPNTKAPLTEGEIWVHKTDTTSSGQVHLTYKITVLIKPQYFMHINSLSKKYDGKPVEPQILSVTENRGGEWFDWTEPPVAEYGQYKSTHTSQVQFNSWVPVFNDIPVTIRYEVIPNETETEVSVKTYFKYKLDDNDITKVTTVNINLEDNSANPKPVYTLDGASDTVLMASTGGNYRIKAFETAEGDWQVDVTFIDLKNQSQVTTYNVLTVSADMQIKKRDVTSDEMPSQAGDGKKIWSSKNEALDFAKREAEASLNVKESDWKYGVGFEGNYNRKTFADIGNTGIKWKDRYSDSYFYADGETEVHTDTISVKVGEETACSYSIQHDYMYMYYAFHYYAEVIPSGDTVPFSAEDIAKVEIKYFLDLDEDGIWDDNNNGVIDEEEREEYFGDKNNPPKDAGNYILEARYIGETFEAYSYVTFEIRKRPIKILAVENWLKYFTKKELDELQRATQSNSLKTYPLNPTENKYNFGKVIFDDVVDGDIVEISPAVYAYFNEITISHNENKITLRYDAVYQKDSKGDYVYDEAGNKIVLRGYQVDWLGDLAERDASGNYQNDNRNYELTNVSNFRYEYLRDENGNIQYENGQPDPNDAPLNFSYVHVPGTLSYLAEGTIFKKTETETSVWRKFWPYWDEEYLKWDPNVKNELGHYYVPSDTENRIDYHSPSNASHQNYVYLRTVNGDRGETYSIDIEYGSMQFVFAKTVWDVNKLDYVPTPNSFWLGNDGTTNSITVINRSDADIKYSISVAKETTWGWNLNIDLSKYPEGLDDNDQASLLGASVENIVVKPPINPETKQGLGVPTESTHYLIVSGNPLNTNKQQVGTITVTIGPNTKD